MSDWLTDDRSSSQVKIKLRRSHEVEERYILVRVQDGSSIETKDEGLWIEQARTWERRIQKVIRLQLIGSIEKRTRV